MEDGAVAEAVRTTRTVVVTGGGSGGHITPILAVAREIKRRNPDTRIVYIGQTGDGFDDVVQADENIDEMFAVRAGKFRRYHGEGLRQLLDLPTVYHNLRDAVMVLVGIVQSFLLLRRIRPGAILTRGSYVSVPVCLAAALLRVPYVTHDSDAIPSLTNRIIAKWAALHAVALPEELYQYPIDRTRTVGVPISHEYQYVSPELRSRYRREAGLGDYTQVLLVTGGGLGAQRINEAVLANTPELLSRYPGLVIIHVTGRAHEAAMTAAYTSFLSSSDRERVRVKGFVSDMYRLSGAADVVIARGGATNLAELAVQGKACIIIPNPILTGGHQTKNAKALQAAGAIIQMSEEQIEQELRLTHELSKLFDDPAQAKALGSKLRTFAKPEAATLLADYLVRLSDGKPIHDGGGTADQPPA